MKMKSKKLISLILAVVLVLGIFPMAGFATGEEDPVNDPPAITQTPGDPSDDGTGAPAGDDGTGTPAGDDGTGTPPGDDGTGTPPGDDGTGTPPGDDDTGTPEPAAVVLADLSSDDLYAYLLTLNGDELTDALGELTQDQIDSIDGIMTTEQASEWFGIETPEAVVLADLSGEELYTYLHELSLQDEDALYTALDSLSEEQVASLQDYMTAEEALLWFDIIPANEAPAINFTAAGPFMPPVVAKTKAYLMRGMSGASLSLESDEEDNGLVLNKSVSTTDSTNYKITMEAYTTGSVSSSEEPIPTDFILVLDQSRSMEQQDFISGYSQVTGNDRKNSNLYNLASQGKLFGKVGDAYYPITVSIVAGDRANNRVYRYILNGVSKESTGDNTNFTDYTVYTPSSYIKRTAALQQAAHAFVNEVEDSAGGTINHRIAVVGFSNKASNNYGATGLYIGSSFYTYDASTNSAQSKYTSAFQDMNDSADVTRVENSIDQVDNVISASGTYTNPDLGFIIANGIFYNNPVTSGQRNRVVVFFTDGRPNNSTDQNNFDASLAATTIDKAYDTKNVYGATVYSIGVFSGANPSDMTTVNRYMNHVSSNFPLADTLNGNFSGSTSDGYYLTAGDTNSLDDIFTNIVKYTTKPDVELGDGAVTKDYITNYFNVPGDLQVVVKEAAKNSSGDFDIPVDITNSVTVSVNAVDRSVSISGFDFDANCLSDEPREGNFYGKKLIIEFILTRAPGFIGGNDVPTNIPATSGVYKNSTDTSPLETFGDSPIANVPILYNTATVQNRNIYAGDDVVLSSLLGGNYTTSSPGSTYTLGDEVTNQYADVAYTIREGAAVIGTYKVPATAAIGSTACTWTEGTSTIEDLTVDRTYTVTATITPSIIPSGTSVGTAGDIDDLDIGTAYVNVYIPTVTPQDLSVYLTHNPTQDELNAAAISGVAWEHEGTAANTVTMGAAPGLTYTFSGLPASPDYPTGDIGIAIPSVTRTDGDHDVLTSVSMIEKTAAAPAGSNLKLFVLKPVITCSDTTVFLGDNTDLDDRISTTLDWTGTTGAPNVAAPFLTVPTFTLAPIYIAGTDPTGNGGKDAFAPLADSDFKVQLLFGSTDLTQFCIVKNGTTVVTSDDHHFTVLVVSGQLTITKSVTDALDGECFLFTITVNPENGSEYSFQEVIVRNGEKVITGLPKGTYTVTEDTDWSWRYNSNNPVEWVGNDWTLGDDIDDTTIACSVENEDRTPFWLSWETFCPNVFALPAA